MCWLCGRVCPYDGPNELKNGKKYQYVTPYGVMDANEDAEWERLDNFPGWLDTDEDGIPYFVKIENNEV